MVTWLKACPETSVACPETSVACPETSVACPDFSGAKGLCGLSTKRLND
jgi:hypothetical protein